MSDTLFEIDSRTGADDFTHVLLPNMAYACGGNILTKRGAFQVGINDWADVTCAECRSHGEPALRDEIAAMQGRQAGVA